MFGSSCFLTGTSASNFKELVCVITDTVLTPLTFLIIGVGLVMFLWGLVQYISKGGEGSKEAVSLMFWGIVILFVMVSVWGLVKILTGTFGTEGIGAPTPPALPDSTGVDSGLGDILEGVF